MKLNYGGKTNICIDCKKACGGCSWTAVDPETDELKFEPVPGWEAKKAFYMNCGVPQETYHITACPLFEMDEKRPVTKMGELSLEELRHLLAHWRRRGE